MEMTVQSMRPAEKAALGLRRIYESRGFRRVRPGKFEEHALYIENKNFLQSEQIISFMDMDGKLLALKPDVTLSVVKNIPAKPLPTFQKLYYLDEVYRVSRENKEYSAKSQIGIELVGATDAFSGIEVVDLALLSLAALGEDYVLDISHLGFVSGLLSGLHLPHTVERRVFAALHAKSVHEIAAILSEQGVAETDQNRLMALAELRGSLDASLETAKRLITCAEMQGAYDELVSVAQAFAGEEAGKHLHLDFSVSGDLDYYSGLIFLGYIEGVPRSILSGGRYDNLMRKMGKQSGAMGFAVSLDELNPYIRSGQAHDFDLLITYSDHCDHRALLQTVRQLAGGERVRLEREDADLSRADFTWREHRRYENGRLVTVSSESPESAEKQGGSL